jgi:hypothetical protein
MAELWFFFTAHLPNEIYPPTKCKNEQRAIFPKLGKAKLWFFGTALLPNEINLLTKFHVYIFYSFRVMSLAMFKV